MQPHFFLGNSLESVLIALGILIVGFAIVTFLFVAGPLARRLRKAPDPTDSPHILALFRRQLPRAAAPIAYAAVLFAATQPLLLAPGVRNALNVAMQAAFLFAVTAFAVAFARFAIDFYTERKLKRYGSAYNLTALMPVVHVTFWGIALILLLDNAGFKVSALVTGLGIGGVAVALAAQSVLKDVFAYFAIVVDRPFELGDFVVMGEVVGSVEHVGMKTTKIRSLSGEQLVLPNSKMTDALVHNFKRMAERRIQFRFGVAYETPAAQLRAIPAMVREIIEGIERTRFDRAHFVEFGDSRLTYEVAYYLLTPDYNYYMDVQQRINLELLERFERDGIAFAYPTRTVHVTMNGGKAEPIYPNMSVGLRPQGPDSGERTRAADTRDPVPLESRRDRRV